MRLEPFTIDVPQTAIDDLYERLSRTRWPDEPPGRGWERGSNLAYMQELVDHWRTSFDWREQERFLNSFANFRAEVDGLGIHFVHITGQGPNPMPLILTHGWPSTYYEFFKIIPLLADPAASGGDSADAFHVVAPSLPGYGFSDRPAPSRISDRIPALWVSLMQGLGYERFAAFGTDIGAFVTNRMGLVHAGNLLGIQVTLPAEPDVLPDDPDLSEDERAYLERRERTHEFSQSYAHQHRTRPLTLSYGLSDSPVGLAGWIIEKWREWSDSGGDLESRFTKDELLTNIMIYWLTGTVTSSFEPYYDWKLATSALPRAREFYPDRLPGAGSAPVPAGQKIEVPAAVTLLQGGPPREWVERVYGDLRRFSVMPKGGHFAAMEEPELLVEEIRGHFRPLRRAV